MSELKNFKILKFHSKKLEASSFNCIKWIGFWFYRLIKLRFCMGQNAGCFRIKQINAILFLFSFKKIASKIDKRVMLSYLLQYITNALNSIFLTPSKIPTWTSQTNSMKICSICILPQKKNLISNHCLKLKSLGFSVLKYTVLTFC